MPSPSNTSASIETLARQTIWAIAYDDDGIADFLCGLAALALVREFYGKVEKHYDAQRRARVAGLFGELRSICILDERDIAERMRAYGEDSDNDDLEIPF